MSKNIFNLLVVNELNDGVSVLKEGQLVESGTHTQLVSKDGEYKKLHDIQAQAFLPEDKKDQ